MGESTVNCETGHVDEGETISENNEASAMPPAPQNQGPWCWQGRVWSGEMLAGPAASPHLPVLP